MVKGKILIVNNILLHYRQMLIFWTICSKLEAPLPWSISMSASRENHSTTPTPISTEIQRTVHIRWHQLSQCCSSQHSLSRLSSPASGLGTFEEGQAVLQRGVGDASCWFSVWIPQAECVFPVHPTRMQRNWAHPTLHDVNTPRVRCCLGKLELHWICCFIKCFFTEQPITNVCYVFNLLRQHPCNRYIVSHSIVFTYYNSYFVLNFNTFPIFC